MRHFIPIILLVLLGLVNPGGVTSAPRYLDLGPVANTSLFDDGIADNGRGGWSDEGVNDMFTYPPIEYGEVVRNGYHFRIAEPADPADPTVVMLRGERRGREKPQQVEVTADDRPARYVYLLMNAVGSVPKQPAEYAVATCTIRYADGSAAEIPLRDNVEVRPWWCGQWWDNSGAASWPFFMGRNLYSIKWRQYIGVWASQCTNPHPARPIRSLVFRSAGKAAAVIWAITLDDDDYHANEQTLKTHFKRPADVPAGYFDQRAALERAGIFQAAAAAGFFQGVRRVDLIGTDLLAVTVDGAWGEIGAGDGGDRIAELAVPVTFRISSDTDDHYRDHRLPTAVGRHSYESWRGDLPGFPGNTLYEHTCYLELPAPVISGHRYTITVDHLGDAFQQSIDLAYDETTTITPVIKVNQVAYSSRARQRYAYLGWWAGDRGAVDYAGLKTFRVVDESQAGRPAIEGEIVPRQLADPLSGENVYQLDLSALEPGRYHIVVPGLGRSDSFGVGGAGMRAVYRHAMRAFYHQRCGMALTQPFTVFERPACHREVYESGYLVGNRAYHPRDGEPTRSFRGGYHDAGDDDVFTYHLRATAQALTAFARSPGRMHDDDLNLPESGNRVPDVLDEADWALVGYRELQQPDGAVPLGRGNDEDYIRKTYRDKPRPAFGILPARNTSATEYAAVAAQYARLVQPFDGPRAAAYTDSAARALAWALAENVDPEKNTDDRGAYLFQAWAAAELFETTGRADYHDIFLRLYREQRIERSHWGLAHWRPLCTWAYATSQRPEVDPAVQQRLRNAIIATADSVVKRTANNPYRMGHDGRGLGWGNGNGGGYYGDVCLRAYWLTDDQQYLDAASLNADFLLGANPISRTFMTAVGARYPRQPQISPTLYEQPGNRGRTAAGITNFGLADAPPPGYPADIPRWRRVRDICQGAEVSSEFTVTETLGASAILWSALWELEPAAGTSTQHRINIK